MTEITLEAAQAKVAELTEIIAKLLQPTPATTPTVYRESVIELRDGEHYAGPVLDAAGVVLHHLVLMAEKPDAALPWKDALAWAAKVGGSLPNRQEAALIFANCKPHVEGAWHWTSEQHSTESSAWICHFGYGDQYYDLKVNGSCARAVRRLNP